MRDTVLQQTLLAEIRSLHARLNAVDLKLEKLRSEMRAEPEDLVDCKYIADRTGLKPRTVRDGKAGTNAIPRALLNGSTGKRSPVRFHRADADRFIQNVFVNQPAQQKALRLLHLKPQRRRRSA
jgi:hypothetical protein